MDSETRQRIKAEIDRRRREVIKNRPVVNESLIAYGRTDFEKIWLICAREDCSVRFRPRAKNHRYCSNRCAKTASNRRTYMWRSNGSPTSDDT